MTGSVLDIALLVIALAFAFNGYRRGFVIGLLSFIGFFGGALLGIQLTPLAADRIGAGVSRLIVALVVVFALAMVGQTLAVIVGSALRERLPGRTSRIADQIGGALMSAIAALLVFWMVAAPLASAPPPWLASQIRRSMVVAAVDEAVPDPVRKLYGSFGAVVEDGAFPEVFDRLTPTRVPPVVAPDPALASAPAVMSARRSVVKVLGSAPSCNRRLEGSGFVFAPQRVMTNAHVVAGTQSLYVELGSERYGALVVLYDPMRDLAVLAVPGLTARPMSFASPAGAGADAIVIGFPMDGPYTAVPARLRDLRRVKGPDIYGKQVVTREVYTIRAMVRSGNSGGPLITRDGQVLGVIFAAAVDDPQTGFALTAKEAGPVIEAGRTRQQPVGTGACD
jgi:S1-C subfamily serine protease